MLKVKNGVLCTEKPILHCSCFRHLSVRNSEQKHKCRCVRINIMDERYLESDSNDLSFTFSVLQMMI